jgi:hypothetical protein
VCPSGKGAPSCRGSVGGSGREPPPDSYSLSMPIRRLCRSSPL